MAIMVLDKGSGKKWKRKLQKKTIEEEKIRKTEKLIEQADQEKREKEDVKKARLEVRKRQKQ